MDGLPRIIQELLDERAQIERTIAVLEPLLTEGKAVTTEPTNRKPSASRPEKTRAGTLKVGPGHGMTPEGRARLSRLMKKRWRTGQMRKTIAGKR